MIFNFFNSRFFLFFLFTIFLGAINMLTFKTFNYSYLNFLIIPIFFF